MASEFKGTKGPYRVAHDCMILGGDDAVVAECSAEEVGIRKRECNLQFVAESFNVLHTTGKTTRELAGEVEALNSELVAVRNHIRPLSDKAELADTYEKWLLDIGRQVGCQHLDEQLSNCVISVLQGDRDQDELVELRREAEWIRRKLELPDNCPFLAGDGQTVAGEMHVVCSNAHGFKTYIQAHKCNDKQGEIARLTVEITALAERVEVLERERDDLITAATQAYGALVTNEPCYDVINGRAMKRLKATLARVNQPAAVTEGAE